MDVTNGKVIAQLGCPSPIQVMYLSESTKPLKPIVTGGSSMKPITDYAPALEYGVYDSTGVYCT